MGILNMKWKTAHDCHALLEFQTEQLSLTCLSNLNNPPLKYSHLLFNFLQMTVNVEFILINVSSALSNQYRVIFKGSNLQLNYTIGEFILNPNYSTNQNLPFKILTHKLNPMT